MEDLKNERLSSGQKELLILFMEAHREFARNKLLGVEGRLQSQNLWLELTNMLNKEGPVKTITKWQRVWTDLKVKVKRKAAGISCSRRKTGGGAAADIILTEMDIKIVDILSKEAVFGIDGPDGVSLETEGVSDINMPGPSGLKRAGDRNISEANNNWVDITEESEYINNTPKRIKLLPSPSSSSMPSDLESEAEELGTPQSSYIGAKRKGVVAQTADQFKDIGHSTIEEIASIKNEMKLLNKKIDTIIIQNTEKIEGKK